MQRKACMGLTFTNNSAFCNNNKSNLTYSKLADYYNELVLQLKLAEYNLNTAISSEIKNINRSEALETQRKIIKLLNETILPALEFTVSYSYH